MNLDALNYLLFPDFWLFEISCIDIDHLAVKALVNALENFKVFRNLAKNG